MNPSPIPLSTIAKVLSIEFGKSNGIKELKARKKMPEPLII
jgi:hypothetical protein